MELTSRMIEYIEGRDIGDDVRQDLYVKLMELDLPEFETDKAMRDYVYSCLKNIQGNTHYTRANRERLLIENESLVRENLHPGKYDSDPMELLMAAEDIEVKMDILSPLLQGTLESLMIDGMTPEELASVEDVSPNVIYQRIFRIKKALGEK